MKLKRMSIADYADLKPFFVSQRYTLCAYSLPSFLIWTNELVKPVGMVHDGALFMGCAFTRGDELPYLLLPVSPDRKFSPEALHAIAGDLGIGFYRYVSEDYLRHFPRETIAPGPWLPVLSASVRLNGLSLAYPAP